MAASFKVYIDESGDEGFAFDRGSSGWFVLSAVITRASDELAVVKLTDTVRQQLGRPAEKALHFRRLRHEERLVLVDAIAKQPLQTVNILVHKPSLTEPEKFRSRYGLYFYSTRLLLERVSWYCRDHAHPGITGDGTAEIAFSNRSNMSYEELCDYLRVLESRTNLGDVRVDWKAIRPEDVAAYVPDDCMGLQIADAVAGSFLYAVRPTRHGFTEPRYARILRPVVYQHGGRYLGYGIKLFPPEVQEAVETDENLSWIKSDYQ